MNVPQPVESAASLPPQLRTITILELRQDPSRAPGGGAFVSVLSVFLPMVYGAALKLLSESPGSAQAIATSVFECFAVKWRRLHKRTPIGPWLLSATRSIALRERKRLRQQRPARGSVAAEHILLFRRISQLKPKLRNALILRHVLHVSAPETAAALRTSLDRSEKNSAKAFAWVRRKLRKTSLAANLSAAF